MKKNTHFGFLFLAFLLLQFSACTENNVKNQINLSVKYPDSEPVEIQNFFNSDYKSRKILFGYKPEYLKYIDDNTYCALYQPFELKEALAAGELSGKLKEIAETINEDDNPVIMKIKFRE
ncbi:MAG: hypothetical protein LBR13_00950 [Dysgonamonadaceae bacterium]|jgi:hypothetical protein|nr:hypothetical protein [Dysgonamonadaceae bacterium]